MNWNSGVLWGIIGLVGGFFISLIFHLIGIKRKKLCYEIETFPIISDKVSQIKGLEIKYNCNEIENLFYSTIYINNIGNTIIEKEDFAPSHPLSISTSGYFLVDDSNKMDLFSSNRMNNISHSFMSGKPYTIPYSFIFQNEDNARNHIIINFDYIAKEEEITCSLFHTGNISFDGVLKDGKIVDYNAVPPRKRSLIDALLFFFGFEEE